MWKKLSNEEITKTVEKIKEKYNNLINDFNMPKSLLTSFEDRYMNTLKASNDLSVFLLAEIEAVAELYKKEKDRRVELINELFSDVDTSINNVSSNRASLILVEVFGERFPKKEDKTRVEAKEFTSGAKPWGM